MNNKILYALLAVIAIAGFGYLILGIGKSNQNNLANSSRNQTENLTSPTQTEVNSDQSETKTFVVEARPFSFTVVEENDSVRASGTNEIRVKKGDRVKIVFNNIEGFHDFVIDEFTNAKTDQIQANESQTIEFVADKAGLFKYYCSVGGQTDPNTSHRLKGMEGDFIVE